MELVVVNSRKAMKAAEKHACTKVLATQIKMFFRLEKFSMLECLFRDGRSHAEAVA